MSRTPNAIANQRARVRATPSARYQAWTEAANANQRPARRRVEHGRPELHRRRQRGDEQQRCADCESDANTRIREGACQVVPGPRQEGRIQRQHRDVAKRVHDEFRVEPALIERVCMHSRRQHEVDVAGRDQRHALDAEQQGELACRAAGHPDAVQHDRQGPAHRSGDERDDPERVELEHARILAKPRDSAWSGLRRSRYTVASRLHHYEDWQRNPR